MHNFSTTKQSIGLFLWLALCYLTSAAGAIASIQAKSFYAQLNQPSWAPPAWLFGPAWLTLYTLMAIAAWLIWRQGGFAVHKKILTLFIVQLAINALWSWLFFAWHLGFLAFIDIIILWSAILIITIYSFPVSRLAAALLLPYLLWVSFAAALNYSVWQLNPSLLG